MRKEAARWLRQAEADLRAAQASLRAGSYEWACFQAQQSGEKALKALLYNKGRTSLLTRSLRELLQEAQRLEPALSALADAAVFLDQFYLSTRYPNTLAGERSPSEYYKLGDAEKCIRSCELILTTLKNIIKD